MHEREDIARHIGVVVIGRNEGERLARCLRSLADVQACVYVDSASTDGSVDLARAAGVDVIQLSLPPRLTAARGRNAGLARLVATNPDLRYVQFVDGDCEVNPGWIAAGVAALDADARLAIVSGRLRERHPDRSIYNALCDDEWNTPLGEAASVGGNAMARIEALVAVGGYDEAMIAGEEPDLATRLRKHGWRLRRIADEMALHDAAILTFHQWWRRTLRGGHAVAELTDRHPDVRVPAWRKRCRSILFWGLMLPVAVLLLGTAAALVDSRLLVAPVLLLFAWPAQMARLAWRRRRNLPWRVAMASGAFLVIGKFPEVIGLLRYAWGRRSGRRAALIEYKGPARAR